LGATLGGLGLFGWRRKRASHIIRPGKSRNWNWRYVLTQRQQKFGSGKLAAAAIAAAACFVAPASGYADTINYQLQDVMVIVPNNSSPPPPANVTETVTGSFMFNTATDTVTNVQISVSGPDLTAAYTEVFSFKNSQLNPQLTVQNGTDFLTLQFNTQFSSGNAPPTTEDDITLVNFQPLTTTPQGFSIDAASSIFNGDPVAVEATPLPAAIPLFASGLGVLGFLGLRRKRTAATVAI
jgi:hypothetical protein